MKIFYSIIIAVLLSAVNAYAQGAPPSGKTNVCAGKTETYSYTSSKAGYITWQVSNGKFDNGWPSKQVYHGGGTSSEKVTWDSEGGTYGSVSVTSDGISYTTTGIYIAPKLIYQVTKDLTIQSGQSARLEVYNAGGNYSYKWSNGDTRPFIVVYPTTTTTYKVTITQTAWNGVSFECPKEELIKVTVSNTPAITGNTLCCDQEICAGKAPNALQQASGTSLGGGNGTYAYQWQSSTDGSTFSNISGATAVSYSPPSLSQTTWYRRVVTSGGVSNTSPSVKITVIPASLTLGSASYASNAVVRAGTVTVNGNQTPASGVQLTVKGNERVIISPMSATSPTIISPKTIVVIEPCPVQGISAMTGMSIGEDEPRQDMVFVYPNPASDKIMITAVDPSTEVDVTLFNSQGLLKKKAKTKEGKLELKVSDLPKGVYFLHTTDGKKVEKKQILIER